LAAESSSATAVAAVSSEPAPLPTASVPAADALEPPADLPIR